MPKQCLGAILVGLLSVSFIGCGSLRVQVNQPEADLYVSRTGAGNWQRLDPDKRWFVKTTDEAPVLSDEDQSSTPTKSGLFAKEASTYRERFWCWRPFTGYGFVRAQRDGYLSSSPELVDFSRLTWTRLAFELEPTQETIVRRQLDAGFEWIDGRWQRPEDSGWVHRNGRWMSPDEAFTLDQQEEGRVFYEGRWMPASERDRLVREKNAGGQLVEFKGMLVSREEAERLRGIDRQVLDLATVMSGRVDDIETSPVAIMEPASPSLTNEARLKVFNACGFDVEILISGPEFTTSFSLEAFQDKVQPIAPGKYRMAILPASPALGETFLNSYELRPRGGYSLIYYGRPPDLRDLDEVLSVDPTQGIEVPEIQIPELPEQEKKKPERGSWPGAGQWGGRGR